MDTYSISDSHGNSITQGVQGRERALTMAQEMADKRGQLVEVYEGTESESIVVQPRDSSPAVIVRNAIARSVSHDEIVHLAASADESDALDTELICECDDRAKNDDVREYWGTTDAGDEWRVHVSVNA